MIRHIVLFSAKDPADAGRVYEGLKILEGIEGDFFVEIKKNLKMDNLSKECDVVVYGEFADEAALEAYKTHPLYEKSIELVRPIREMRVVANTKF